MNSSACTSLPPASTSSRSRHASECTRRTPRRDHVGGQLGQFVDLARPALHAAQSYRVLTPARAQARGRRADLPADHYPRSVPSALDDPVAIAPSAEAPPPGTVRRTCSAVRSAAPSWAGAISVLVDRGGGGAAPARSVPGHRQLDGRGLHARLPEAHAGRRRAQRRLPAPVRARGAAHADGLVPAVRLHAREPTRVRSAAAPRHHLRRLRARPVRGDTAWR